MIVIHQLASQFPPTKEPELLKYSAIKRSLTKSHGKFSHLLLKYIIFIHKICNWSFIIISELMVASSLNIFCRYGIEQEYTLLQTDVKWPLGWPVGGYPGPQVINEHFPCIC